MSYSFTYSQTADGLFLRERFAESLFQEGLLNCVVEDDPTQASFLVHSPGALSNESETLLSQLVSQHVGAPTVLRIMNLLDPQFAGFMPHKVDFRKHLLPNTHIQKDVVMLANGRPDHALYTYNGERVARIRFVFDLNGYFLVIRRREILGYYTDNDEILEEYTISDETYNIDPSVAGFSEYHLVKAMAERSECRAYVMESLKGVLNGFILQYYTGNYDQEFMQVLNSVVLFFKEYNDSFSTWMTTGAGDFIQQVTTDTLFPFLDLEMVLATEQSPAITVRAYIISRLQVA